MCLIESESFLKKSSQIESIVRPVRKSTERICFRRGSDWKNDGKSSCHSFASIMSRSLTILRLSIVTERVNCADLVMKIHFPFLRSLHLLTSAKYRRSITQQLNRSRLQDDFYECRFVTSRLKLTQIQQRVICRIAEKKY